MTKDYVSLHNHTTFSIGDSILSPKDLLTATADLKQSAVAVTDHGTLSGLWDCLKLSDKPNAPKLIAGCECFFVDSLDDVNHFRHIILLAKNATGYSNLLKINKRAFDQYCVFSKKAIPRVDWKLLEQFSEGLICTTACGNGIIGPYIMEDQLDLAKANVVRLKGIFGDNLALELQPHNLQRRATPYSHAVNQQKINLALKKISQELDVRCIVATDAHYLKKEHHRAQDVLLSISSGQPVSSGSRLRYDKQDFYVKSADEVFAHFERHLPMWGEDFVDSLFANTVYFANQCEKPDWINPAVASGDKCQLPDFPVKSEPDYQQFQEWQIQSKENNNKLWKDVPEDAQFYRYRSEQGMLQKLAKNEIPQEDLQYCIDQMNEEFDVLEYRGFSSYMLIVSDFINWCVRNDIAIGPGRGSCGGSLTAYFTNIHKAYPKKYGMIFSRFLNKYKEAYPDIDVDICSSGRDLLHEYVRTKYGKDNVAHVSNVNTMTPKVYARDLARAFEFGGDRNTAVEIGNAIADSIPDDIKTVKQALTSAPLFAEYAKQYPELAEFAELLDKKPRAWATHAGGIVISKRPLEGLVPLRRDTSGALSVEYDKERAEENGLIKMDTLGLQTLDIIDEVYKLLRERGKTNVSASAFDYEQEDDAAYKLISEGDTFGVFQLEKTAVPVCKALKPKTVDDIALITSLVRPAAKDIIPDLLKVRAGDKPMELLHPSLDRAFKSTYGFGLFEECLMYIAADVAGWNLHDADNLRKMTKDKGKHPEKVAKMRQKFIDDAVANKGFEAEMATKIFDEVVAVFGGYGFNKSLYFSEKVDIYTSEGDFVTAKEVQHVQPGEYLRSRDESVGNEVFVEVVAKHDHGELQLVEVKLDTGERVRCTMDHKFRVKETGEMLPLWRIIELDYSIVVG